MPTGLQYASPSSMDFRLENQNFTPLTNIQYTCEVSKMILVNGSTPQGAQSVIQGNIRRLPGRRAIAGRCDAGYLVTDPIKTAEYKLTIKYKAYPWPQDRTVVYRIGSDVNKKGELTGWKVE